MQPLRAMGVVLTQLLVGDESRCLRDSGLRAFSGFWVMGLIGLYQESKSVKFVNRAGLK